MPADQALGSILHSFRVQWMGDLPDKAKIMGDWGAAADQAKQIAPLCGRKPGVKVIGHRCGLDNCNWVGAKVIVQSAGQFERIPVPFHIAMCNLCRGMNTCVCPPGGGNGSGFGFQYS